MEPIDIDRTPYRTKVIAYWVKTGAYYCGELSAKNVGDSSCILTKTEGYIWVHSFLVYENNPENKTELLLAGETLHL